MVDRGLIGREVDVAIVGAGPAGLAAAIALARSGRSVAVLERTDAEVTGAGESLPPEIRPLLDLLGVGERIEAEALRSPGTASAWGSPELLGLDSFLSPRGPGLHIDRGRFERTLEGAARGAGVSVWRSVRIAAIGRGAGERWRIEGTAGGGRFHLGATVLADASGRGAALARRLGARRTAVDVLVGLVARCPEGPSDAGRDRRLLIEAADDGWWYSLPIPGGGFIAGYITDHGLVPRGRRERADVWRIRLAQTAHTGRRVSFNQPIGEIRTVAAGTSYLDRSAGPGWVALGDASLTLDPLSGQGVFRGVESGLAAAAAVDRSLAGDPEALGRYAAWAGRRAEASLLARDAFYRLEARWPRSSFWRRRHAGGPRAPRGPADSPRPRPASRDVPSRLPADKAAHHP